MIRCSFVLVLIFLLIGCSNNEPKIMFRTFSEFVQYFDMIIDESTDKDIKNDWHHPAKLYTLYYITSPLDCPSCVDELKLFKEKSLLSYRDIPYLRTIHIKGSYYAIENSVSLQDGLSVIEVPVEISKAMYDHLLIRRGPIKLLTGPADRVIFLDDASYHHTFQKKSFYIIDNILNLYPKLPQRLSDLQ